MDEVHYLISDASKKVDVEAHVLRYWEDELGLEIPRNEMGHRYYIGARRWRRSICAKSTTALRL